MKYKNNLMATMLVLFALSLSGCGTVSLLKHYTIIKESTHPMIGQEFEFSFPMMYRENLVNCNELKLATYCLYNDETNFRLGEIMSIGRRHSVTPVFIPSHTKFKIIGSFKKRKNKDALVELDYWEHYLIVIDDAGFTSEVSQSLLELLLKDSPYNGEETALLEKEYRIYNNKPITKFFCFRQGNSYYLQFDYQVFKANELIKKLKLNLNEKITTEIQYCSSDKKGKGLKLTFNNFNTYLTMRLHVNDLYGKWRD